MTKTKQEQAELSRKAGVSKEAFKGEYDPEVEIGFLRELLQEADRDREKDRKEYGGLKSLFRDLREQVEAIDPPKIDYKRPKLSKPASPIVHVSHWCDWHEGAVQDPDEIEGFNEFNPDILRARLKNCVRDQLEWVEVHRKNYVVDESRDLFTGDLISGGIHPELLWTNEYPPPVQAINAGELLAELIAMKAPHFDRVVVDFVTVDNHGRLTKKPQSNEAGLNCWGYVTGMYAKERLRDFPNVKFNLYPVIQQVVIVAGRRYLLTHGDRVRGWAGFPWYGLDRKVAKESIKRMRRGMAKFDRVILGHWHTPLAHPWYWIGGSASGTTSYDHGEGRESEPIQSAWMVHPRHGEFDRTDWNLRS